MTPILDPERSPVELRAALLVAAKILRDVRADWPSRTVKVDSIDHAWRFVDHAILDLGEVI